MIRRDSCKFECAHLKKPIVVVVGRGTSNVTVFLLYGQTVMFATGGGGFDATTGSKIFVGWKEDSVG